MSETDKEATINTDSMVDVLLRSLVNADRVVIETMNALGEMDAHYLHAPVVLEDLGKAASERDALQAENEKLRSAQSYVYIGKDGKSVQARDLEDARDALQAYALEATKAITSLTPSGSEWFGPELYGIYTADLEACVNFVKDERQLYLDRFKAERAKYNALQARVAELEGAVEKAKILATRAGPVFDSEYINTRHLDGAKGFHSRNIAALTAFYQALSNTENQND